MAHWEAAAFKTEDGQDVIVAKGTPVVSGDWQRMPSGSADGSSRTRPAVAASFGTDPAVVPAGEAMLIREFHGSSLAHWQKAFLLLVGGLVIFYLRRWLRTQGRRPPRPVVEAQMRAEGKGNSGLSFSKKDETFSRMDMT